LDLFYLFQAAEIIGCPAWELADKPTFWQESAFWYRRVLNRVPELTEAINAQREKMLAD